MSAPAAKGTEHDLEREADDQAVTVQRPVPPGSGHHAAQPGSPRMISSTSGSNRTSHG